MDKLSSTSSTNGRLLDLILISDLKIWISIQRFDHHTIKSILEACGRPLTEFFKWYLFMEGNRMVHLDAEGLSIKLFTLGKIVTCNN